MLPSPTRDPPCQKTPGSVDGFPFLSRTQPRGTGSLSLRYTSSLPIETVGVMRDAGFLDELELNQREQIEDIEEIIASFPTQPK